MEARPLLTRPGTPPTVGDRRLALFGGAMVSAFVAATILRATFFSLGGPRGFDEIALFTSTIAAATGAGAWFAVRALPKHGALHGVIEALIVAFAIAISVPLMTIGAIRLIGA